jgi:hypothetical protein
MRALLATLVLALSSTANAGESPARGRYSPAERTLTAKEIERYAAPYLPAIKACYLEHARGLRSATGELSLRLVVYRDGGVVELSVEAPGVTGKRLRGLERCVRTQVAGWHFPPRSELTTAILPYYFLKLDLPGTGPQPSCWSPRGCPEPRPLKAR